LLNTLLLQVVVLEVLTERVAVEVEVFFKALSQ
jgi:hypothetical protein